MNRLSATSARLSGPDWSWRWSCFILPSFLNQFLLSLAILTLYWAYLGQRLEHHGRLCGAILLRPRRVLRHWRLHVHGACWSTTASARGWALLVGAALAGLFGLVMGYLLFRFGIRGHFFALGTFAVAEMMRLFSTELEFINTSIGIHIPLVRGDSWLKMQFEETLANYYYVILGSFCGRLPGNHCDLAAAGWAITSRPSAKMRKRRRRWGVDVLRYKIVAVAISGALTAIGGSFFAQYFLFVDPTLAFGVSVSVQILLRPIVGGVGTIWGPLVGALLLTPLSEIHAGTGAQATRLSVGYRRARRC